MDSRKKIKWAGMLWLASILAGALSVAPAIDSTNYLIEAAQNFNQVVFAAVFQFAMSLAYMGVAILLYPNIKKFDSGLSIGFLSFRIIAVSLSIIGTILLLSILALSQEYVQNPLQNSALIVLGNVLKISRDHTNHVFMILALCSGNCLFYLLLFKSKLIPRWLSMGGIITALLSISASILFLFQKVDIITYEYLALNVPTAIQELVLGVWLIAKGFDNQGTSPQMQNL